MGSTKNMHKFHHPAKVLFAVALIAITFFGLNRSVHAADIDFSDGITVDSKLDTSDANIGDSECDDGNGNCTLRAAMEEANSDPDANTIRFNLTGTADYTVNGQSGYTINPANPLPQISESVTIDGYTQPGSSVNTNNVGQPFNGTILVQIDGSGMTGLQVGLFPKATDNVTIRGISLTQLLGGVVIEAANDVAVEGSLIGISPDGQALGNRQAGVIVIDGGNVRIGGSAAASRNVISYNDTDGAGAGHAISTQPSGPTTATNNLVIQGNYIGTGLDAKIDETNRLKNAGGVVIQGPGNNGLIGGTQLNQANIIAGNQGFGVGIVTYSLSGLDVAIIPQKNAIIGNQIYNNSTRDLSPGGPNLRGLGIDLGQLDDSSNPPDGPDSYINFGATLNDAGDTDTGANGYINFPVLNSVVQDGDDAIVNFSLDAADSPTNQYRVELFANDTADQSGYGEGQTFIGAFTVSNGDNQQTTVAIPAGFDLVGKSISATTTAVDATTQSGFGATSEFAKNVVAVSAEDGNSSLANTGTNLVTLYFVGISSTVLTGALIFRRKFIES